MRRLLCRLFLLAVVVLSTLGSRCGTSTPAFVTVTTDSLPDGSVGAAYSGQLNFLITGDSRNLNRVNWGVSSGSLPPGLVLNSTGVISGTPTRAGQFNFTVTVGVAVGDIGNMQHVDSAPQPLSIKINPPGSPSVASLSFLPSTVTGGQMSTGTITLSGPAPTGGTIVQLLSASVAAMVPPNVTVSAGATTLTFTATTIVVTTQIIVDVSAGTMSGSQTATLTVNPPLSIATTSLPAGTAGSPYSSSVMAMGGTPVYFWSETTMPPLFDAVTGQGRSGACLGLALDVLSNFTLTLAIRGMPTTPGTCGPFTVQIKDSSTPQPMVTSRSLSIVVAAMPTLSITTTSLPAGTAGTAYSSSVMATGGTPAYMWSETTTPAHLFDAMGHGISGACVGLTLTTLTSTTLTLPISGTPTTAGTCGPFTVQIKDASTPQHMASSPSLSIVVAAAGADFSLSPTPSSQTVPGAGGSAAYTVTVTPLNGFAGTVTFSVAGLPTGATASFNPPSVVLPISTTTMTVTASAATPNGMSSLTVTGTSGGVNHTTDVTFAMGIPGSSLCPAGTYPFLFNGFNSPRLLSNSALIIAGVFTIDATGSLSGGAEDINSPSLITARQLDPLFSSCTIVSGNRGILILSNGFSIITYHFTIDPATNNGEFIEFDDTTGNGSHGSGFFESRSGTPLSGLPGLVGDKTVALSGYFGNGVRVAAVGRFTIDAATCTSTSTTCAISNGVMDSNAGPPGLPTAGPLTGSFAAPDANGRGSATLVVPNPINGQSVPMNFTYYIGHNTGLSVEDIVLVQSPDIRSATVPTLGGRVQVQGGCCIFDSTSLGTVVFSTAGVVATTGNPSVAIGVMTGTGTAHMAAGTLTGTLDQNAGGTLTLNAQFTAGGSYTVASNGRTTFTFTAGGITKNQVAYLFLPPGCPFGCTRGIIMDASGSDVSFGEFAPPGRLGAPFTNADLHGAFRVNSKSPTSPITLNESGQATLDGNGTLATSFGLTVDITAAGLSTDQMFMGTYSVSGNGRVTVPLTSVTGGQTQNLVFWIIRPTVAGPRPGGQFVGISTVTPGDIGPILLGFVQ